jgi:pentatricopeptide repeat protein
MRYPSIIHRNYNNTTTTAAISINNSNSNNIKPRIQLSSSSISQQEIIKRRSKEVGNYAKELAKSGDVYQCLVSLTVLIDEFGHIGSSSNIAVSLLASMLRQKYMNRANYIRIWQFAKQRRLLTDVELAKALLIYSPALENYQQSLSVFNEILNDIQPQLESDKQFESFLVSVMFGLSNVELIMKIYGILRERKHVLTSGVYNYLINFMIKNLKLDYSKQLYADAMSGCVKFTREQIQLTISAYCSIERFDLAITQIKLLNNILSIPVLSLFLETIKRHVKNNHKNKSIVLELVDELRGRRTLPDVSENARLYCAILAVLAEAASISRAHFWFNFWMQNTTNIDSAYVREARQKMFNMLILAYSNVDMFPDCVSLLEVAQSKYGIVPDRVTINTIFNCCRNVDDVHQVLGLMRVYKIKPDTVSYTTIIHKLCDSTRVSDALKFYNYMKNSPDPVEKPNAVTISCLVNSTYRDEEFVDGLYRDMVNLKIKPHSKLVSQLANYSPAFRASMINSILTDKVSIVKEFHMTYPFGLPIMLQALRPIDPDLCVKVRQKLLQMQIKIGSL